MPLTSEEEEKKNKYYYMEAVSTLTYRTTALEREGYDVDQSLRFLKKKIAEREEDL